MALDTITASGIDFEKVGWVEKDGDTKVHYTKIVSRRFTDGKTRWLDAPACGTKADLTAFETSSMGGIVTCGRCLHLTKGN